jgi:hypothetical protein
MSGRFHIATCKMKKEYKMEYLEVKLTGKSLAE